MAQVFSWKSKAFIDNSVLTWGTDEQRRLWREWSENRPIRQGPDDPTDDGTGPMAEDVRDAVVDCVRQRYLYLLERTKSPIATEDSIADDENDATLLKCIARWLLGNEPAW